MGPPGSERPTVRKRRGGSADHIEHAIDVAHHLFICETDGPKTLARDDSIASPILIGIMGVAVDLDHQCLRRTEEVDDVRTNDRLPTEFKAQPGLGKVTPEPLFRLGRLVAHLSRSFGKSLDLPHPNPSPEGEGLFTPASGNLAPSFIVPLMFYHLKSWI